MNLKQLFEELAASMKKYNDYIEIFKNPNLNELNSLKKRGYVRFAIDRRKGKSDIYIWPAHVLHAVAANKLKIPYPSNEIMYGEGEFKKNASNIKGSWSFFIDNYQAEVEEILDAMFGMKKSNPEYKGLNNKLQQELKNFKNFASKKWENDWVDISILRKQMTKYIKKIEKKS